MSIQSINDAPKGLLSILRPKEEEEEKQTESSSPAAVLRQLTSWCNEVEQLFNATKSDETRSTGCCAVLETASQALHVEIVTTLHPRPPSDEMTETRTVHWNDCEAKSISSNLAKSIRESSNENPFESLPELESVASSRFPTTTPEERMNHLPQLLRASKNLIRIHNLSSSVSILQCHEMIDVYLALLHNHAPHYDDPKRYSTSLFSSLAMFHSMFGETPHAHRARTHFVDSTSGLSILMELFLRSLPTPLLLSITRHIHNLVGHTPSTLSEIDRILQTNHHLDLVSILIPTLAWTLRSSPFPGPPSDRRSDLALEILRILFAIRATTSPPNEELMTQIGILIGDVLHFSNADLRSYNCKLAFVNLLMEVPLDYIPYLIMNDGITPLIRVLKLQLDSVIVERTSESSTLFAILIVWNRLCQSHPTVLQTLKSEIFPPQEEAKYEASRKELRDSKTTMEPIDAPPHTLRWKLIQLMTWPETNTKRCANELLWTVCGENKEEFVLRTGFGNAVFLLGLKGLVTLPGR